MYWLQKQKIVAGLANDAASFFWFPVYNSESKISSLKLQKMGNQTIELLVKNKLTAPVVPSENPAAGCCGGAPVSNEDACCVLDEVKKSEGEAGCGCNTATAAKSSCC